MLIQEQLNKLYLLEKYQHSQRFFTFLKNQMVEYSKVNVKLSDTQLKKLKMLLNSC